ncbi:MAG: hypothetical protein EA377_06355 [Phycisphaerales bacterium]|nr:MAG: hypothetical protein EA377_06355 [Phycisphaerales bacterium]
MKLHATCLLLCLLATIPALGASPDPPPHLRVLNLIPTDAGAVLYLPNARSTNDHLVQFLEGMDRSNLLMGSRPLDLLKTWIDLPIAFDELGPVVVALMPGDQPHEFDWLLIVRATSARGFIDGNFELRENDAFDSDRVLHTTHGRLGECAVLARGSHVLIARDADLLTQLRNADDADERQSHWEARLLDPLAASEQHLAFWSDAGSWSGLLRALDIDRLLLEEAADGVQAHLDTFSHGAAAHFADSHLTLQFDPLGLFVRARASWRDDHALIGQARQRDPAEGPFAGLPRRAYRAVAAADLSGWPAEHRPKMLRGIDRIRFAALSGRPGLLSDASAMIEGASPATAHTLLRNMIRALAGGEADIEFQDESPPTGYRVKLDAERSPWRAMILPLLFQNGEWRGALQHDDAGSFISFSVRDNLRERWRIDPNDDLSADPVLRSMRSWFPSDPEFVWSANPARLAEPFRGLLQMSAQRAGFRWREPNAAAPPFAGAAKRTDSGIEGIMVLPGPTMASWIDMLHDAAVQQRLRRPESDS